MSDTYEYIEDAQNADYSESDDAKKSKVEAQPLGDEDLRAGGMAPVKCWVKTKKSKSSIRKTQQRKKGVEEGKREINVVAADNEDARQFIRKMAAATIHDASLQPVIEMVISNAEYRSLIADLYENADLWKSVRAAWREPRPPAEDRRSGIKRFLEAALRHFMQSAIYKIGNGVSIWLLQMVKRFRS